MVFYNGQWRSEEGELIVSWAAHVVGLRSPISTAMLVLDPPDDPHVPFQRRNVRALVMAHSTEAQIRRNREGLTGSDRECERAAHLDGASLSRRSTPEAL